MVDPSPRHNNMSNETKLVKAEIVPQELGLDKPSTESLEIAFAPFFKEARELSEEAKSITDPKEARVVRLKLVKVRTGAEKERKHHKAAALLFGKGVDGVNNFLLAGIVPVEKSLEAIEKAEERRIADELAKLTADRTDKLRPFIDVDAPIPNVGAMTDDQFQVILSDSKLLFDTKEAAKAKAEADRVKQEAEEAAERVRIAKENEQLKKEAAAREKVMQKERDEAEAIRVKEAKEAAAELKKVEDAAKVERENAIQKEKVEAAKRSAAELELNRIKHERERAEADKQAAIDNAEKAPDKEKLIALAATIRGIENPSLTSKGGKAINKTISDSLEKFAAWVEKEAAKI